MVMAEPDTRSAGREHLASLRAYVLDPVSAAETAVEREATEIRRERDAFEAFADRVEELAADSPRRSALPATTVLDERPRRSAGAARRAYDDTVASLPHYDEVYGESIVANAAAELGPDAASLLVPDNDGPLTERHKSVLAGAARRAATERDGFLNTLEVERESLRAAGEELTALLDELDASVVPDWYHERFESRLLEVVRDRQAELAGRSMSYVDGHDLCEYLNADVDWTYPVCIAVARLLESVTVRD